MKQSSVRGTPYHHIGSGQTAHQGIAPGTPGGSNGETTLEQYRGTGMSTTQGPGTPYHSQAGNGPEYRRERAHGTNVESSDHGNQNNPASNGQGVVLDHADSYERGFAPQSEPTLDSPVPRRAPTFDTGFVRPEDEAHLGRGNERGAEDLIRAGGVMSRGMIGTSKASDTDEGELTKDDVLPGTAPYGAD